MLNVNYIVPLLGVLFVLVGCPSGDDATGDDDDDVTGDDDVGDDDATGDDDSGDDDTTNGPLGECGFSELPAASIQVAVEYDHDAQGDWAWGGVIDAWVWPVPWSRNHGMGVFHHVELEGGECRLLSLDPGACGEPCGPGEMCSAAGTCEQVWQDGAAAGTLTVTTLADDIELSADGSGYLVGHYSEDGLPADMFAVGDPIGAGLSGDEFPPVAGLSARGVAPINTDMAGTWFVLQDGQDNEVTWSPGTDPDACIELVINGHNAAHGLPLDPILHCVSRDDGSLNIPQALVEAFTVGAWLGDFNDVSCLGMDCIPSEISRTTRHSVEAEPGPVELVVRSTTFFGWEHW